MKSFTKRGLISSIFLFIIYCSVLGQEKVDSFELSGNIPYVKDSIASLAWFAGKAQFDRMTTKVINGKFVFKSSLQRPALALVHTENSEFAHLLFIENGKMSIEKKDSGDVPVVKGSVINDDYIEYEKIIRANTDTSKSMEKQYIRDNPHKFLSVFNLLVWFGGTELNELKSLYNGLDETLKQTPEGQHILRRINYMSGDLVGKPAIDFVQRDINGNDLKLSSYKGKYVLIDFWASWCGPCRMENPRVLKEYAKYRKKGFEVIGISLDSNDSLWRDAVTKDKLTWPQVCDLKGMDNAAAVKYNIVFVPANYLVDPDGIIIAKNLRGAALGKKLEEIFQK